MQLYVLMFLWIFGMYTVKCAEWFDVCSSSWVTCLAADQVTITGHVCGHFHVTDITSGEQNFGNKTIFYKLIFYSFCWKFVQIFLTWYLTSSRKETLISVTNVANMLVLNSVTDITKKSTYDFSCSLDSSIPVN